MNALTSSLTAKKVWWIDEEGGADGSGMGNQAAAILATYNAIPDYGTMGIPYGRFRTPDRIVFNRSVNVEGHGPGSCLWLEQDVFPYPSWHTDGYPGIQFGVPYAGFGGIARTQQHLRYANFSVQGASDVNPKYGLGMFSVMHSTVENLHSMARCQRAPTYLAAWNGTKAEILCDANSGAGSFPQTTYFNGNPTAVSGATATVTPPTTWTANGLRRKFLHIASGPGYLAPPVGQPEESTAYRIISHTAAGVMTVASWYNNGPPDVTSVIRIFDGLTYPNKEAHVILGTLDGVTAPFPGRPAWVDGYDPMNANEFRFVLRGNSGDSGSGLLVEAQLAGGNNSYRGLFEGFSDSGSYNAAYGVPKYCAKIYTSLGFKVEGHFEAAGLVGTDPNLILDGSCHNFEIGPNAYVDQELRITNCFGFEINGGIYTRVNRVGTTAASAHRISPAAYVGTLI